MTALWIFMLLVNLTVALVNLRGLVVKFWDVPASRYLSMLGVGISGCGVWIAAANLMRHHQ